MLDINPYSAYYADFASPLMFVISLAQPVCLDRRSASTSRSHWDTARRILDWARDHGDRTATATSNTRRDRRKGTKNQGWKDSGDAIVYDDGTPVPSPIATCELQGYWYAAQQLMALLCVGDGRAGRCAPAFCAARRRSRNGSTATGGSRTSSSSRWRSIPTSAASAR